MITIIDNFFDDEMFIQMQNHVSNKLSFTPRYYPDKPQNKDSFYGNRFDLIHDNELKNLFINQAEKKFKIKIKDISADSGIDLRNLDRFMPHTDQQAGKLNIFIMLKGQTAVTNGIVFYTDNNLDMHVGFRENRAVMFPSLKMHSPHLNKEPSQKRYTATLFVKDYELK